MSWRYNIGKFLDNKKEENHIYEFGIYTGQSIIDIDKALSFNDKFAKFFGFDSFCGMPEEKEEKISQECWSKGNFSSLEYFNSNNIDECMSKLCKKIEPQLENIIDLVLIPGFFEDSLKDEIVKTHNMKPATLIDIDCDIYSGAKTALDFMFRNNLVDKGTIISYDDWGGTPGWKYNLDGESRAHLEICQKYKTQCSLLAQYGTQYPHVQTIFKVEKIGK